MPQIAGPHFTVKVVAQLVGRSLLTIKILGSNPVIGQICVYSQLYWKTIIKKKEAGNALPKKAFYHNLRHRHLRHEMCFTAFVTTDHLVLIFLWVARQRHLIRLQQIILDGDEGELGGGGQNSSQRVRFAVLLLLLFSYSFKPSVNVVKPFLE